MSLSGVFTLGASNVKDKIEQKFPVQKFSKL